MAARRVLPGYSDAPGVSVSGRLAVQQQLDDRLPEPFTEVLERVFAFAHPASTSATDIARWVPTRPRVACSMMPVAVICAGRTVSSLAAKVAANQAHSSGSGWMALDSIMALTCGDALQRTSLDVLWRLF